MTDLDDARAMLRNAVRIERQDERARITELEAEVARLQGIVGQQPHTAYLEAVQRACDERMTSLKHEARAWQTRAEADERQIAEARIENDHLRAALAMGPGPCPYCALPKERWAECAAGFPGCGRGDDAMLCPHVGAAMAAERKLEAVRVALERIASSRLSDVTTMPLEHCARIARDALVQTGEGEP